MRWCCRAGAHDQDAEPVPAWPRQGYDLQLTRYDERGWRATFYTAGMEYSLHRRGTRRNGGVEGAEAGTVGQRDHDLSFATTPTARDATTRHVPSAHWFQAGSNSPPLRQRAE